MILCKTAWNRWYVLELGICRATLCRSMTRKSYKLHERWRKVLRSRLTGVGFKPLRAAVTKSYGGERRRKSRHLRRQVRLRKTSVSESSFEASIAIRRCQNQRLVSSLGRAWRLPVYWPSDIRRADGVILIQALVWNYENHPVACKPKGTRGEPSRLIVGMATDGADSFVVALKVGNTTGAKGRSQYRSAHDQPGNREESWVTPSLHGVLTRAGWVERFTSGSVRS